MLVWLEVEKPIDEPWARLIERKLSLTSIQSLNFKDRLVKDLKLQFSLGQMNKGKLILLEGAQDKADQPQKRTFEIELLGYPSPIGIKKPIFKSRVKSEKSKLLYPTEVYEKLYADPNQKDQDS